MAATHSPLFIVRATNHSLQLSWWDTHAQTNNPWSHSTHHHHHDRDLCKLLLLVFQINAQNRRGHFSFLNFIDWSLQNISKILIITDNSSTTTHTHCKLESSFFLSLFCLSFLLSYLADVSGGVCASSITLQYSLSVSVSTISLSLFLSFVALATCLLLFFYFSHACMSWVRLGWMSSCLSC